MLPFTVLAQTSPDDPAIQEAKEETAVVFDLGRMFGYLNTLEKEAPDLALSRDQLEEIYQIMEGLLSINRGDNQKGTVIIRPNEKVSITKEEGGILRKPAGPASGQRTGLTYPQRIPVKDVNVERRIDPIKDISWKDREWVIRGKTMEELSVMLERRYNVEIDLGDKVVGSFRFSGILKDETLEQVLFAIRSTAPVDYDIDAKRVVLTENKRLRKQYERLLKEELNP